MIIRPAAVPVRSARASRRGYRVAAVSVQRPPQLATPRRSRMVTWAMRPGCLARPDPPAPVGSTVQPPGSPRPGTARAAWRQDHRTRRQCRARTRSKTDHRKRCRAGTPMRPDRRFGTVNCRGLPAGFRAQIDRLGLLAAGSILVRQAGGSSGAAASRRRVEWPVHGDLVSRSRPVWCRLACMAGLYGCCGLWLWYGRGGARGGRDRWRAWLPGRSDELRRPGRASARGRGPAGGVPAGDGDRAGRGGQDPAGRAGGPGCGGPVR
jgi:hypothetical protein